MLKRLMILITGPIIGLAYVVILPFIGVAMLIGLTVSKLVGRVTDVLCTAVSFSWRPTEAYLAGKRGRAKKAEEKKGG